MERSAWKVYATRTEAERQELSGVGATYAILILSYEYLTEAAAEKPEEMIRFKPLVSSAPMDVGHHFEYRKRNKIH